MSLFFVLSLKARVRDLVSMLPAIAISYAFSKVFRTASSTTSDPFLMILS